MVFGKKSEEEKAQAAAAARARELVQEKEREDARLARAAAVFWASPRGRARKAFQDGDLCLQSEFEVMAQGAVIEVMVGSSNTTLARDPTATLNAITAEGWELITGSFVFVVQQEQSRDKFMSSGQNVAIQGVTMGYYLFRRNEGNHTKLPAVA